MFADFYPFLKVHVHVLFQGIPFGYGISGLPRLGGESSHILFFFFKRLDIIYIYYIYIYYMIYSNLIT